MVWFGKGLEWFWCRSCGLVSSIVTLLDHTLILIELNWLVLAYNINLREYVLINHESSLGGILLTAL
jgi:hypothetical protein